MSSLVRSKAALVACRGLVSHRRTQGSNSAPPPTVSSAGGSSPRADRGASLRRKLTGERSITVRLSQSTVGSRRYCARAHPRIAVWLTTDSVTGPRLQFTLQLPEPKRWSLPCMSTTTLLARARRHTTHTQRERERKRETHTHTAHALVNIKIISYSNAADPVVRRRSASPLRCLGCWLALTGCCSSRLPEAPGSALCRSGNWSSQSRNGPGVRGPDQTRAVASLEPRWRTAGVPIQAQFPNPHPTVASSVSRASVERSGSITLRQPFPV